MAEETLNLDKARVLVIDESHEPRIHVGDHVLVNEGDTNLTDGDVYVVDYGEGSIAMPSQLATKFKDKITGRIVFSEHILA